jgi:hypothetical protein
VIDMFDELFDVAEGIFDRTVAQPIDDVVEVVDGLTELELREAAAVRLGSTVVEGMLLSELIEWYNTST